jgi:predicted lipoprotein with Yx(FWY)xxD motif
MQVKTKYLSSPGWKLTKYSRGRKMNKKRILTMFVSAVVFVLALAACQPVAATETAAPAVQATTAATMPPAATATTAATQTEEVTPFVEVSDQDIVDDSVTIAEVVSSGPGWLVIHAEADGNPGPVLGYTAVEDGENTDVVVEIDAAQATDTLYAMLHTDAGIIGTYEFPGDDVPVTIGSEMVSIAFTVTKAQAASGAGSGQATVMVGSNPDLGDFLVDSNGMTLYLFTRDEPGVSNCSGGCLENWPPLLVEGDPVAGEGVTGDLATITLADGTKQVTYNDMPLYYYIRDVNPGDTTGQGVGEVWFVVPPSEAGASAGENATVMVASSPELGDFLVDSEGMTLYLFTNDEPGVSNCTGGCLENWPPLLIEGDPVAGEGVNGKLDTITLADGTKQVTYNDMPLYYYIKDVKPGDTTGQQVGDVWFVVPPESATVMVSNNPKLGDFLVDSKGMTLYLFTNDEPGVSNCTGGCLENWPPLLVEGDPVAGEGVTGKLGVITLADGTRQVTYNDMPLYYYIKDVKAGDTTGQNVGEVWFVVEPQTDGY